MKIALLTDSAALFTKAEMAQYNINVLPLHIIIDGENVIDDSPANFAKYNIMQKIIDEANISTSQNNVAEMHAMFDKCLKTADKIMCFCVPAFLSSQAKTMQQAIETYDQPDKVVLMDNYFTAHTLKLFLIKVSKMLQAGATVEDIIAFFKQAKKEELTILIPGSISKLAHSGRLKNIITVLLGIARMNAVIRVKAKPIPIGIGRTMKTIAKYVSSDLKRFFRKDNRQLEDYQILLCSNKALGTSNYKYFEDELSKHGYKFQDKSAQAIHCVHIGAEVVVVVLLPKTWLK